MDQCGETFGIEFVGLIDVTHDDLGFGCVSQERDAPGLFELVGDPAIVTDGFEGHRSSFWEFGKESFDLGD